jgi:hypothetical protein
VVYNPVLNLFGAVTPKKLRNLDLSLPLNQHRASAVLFLGLQIHNTHVFEFL